MPTPRLFPLVPSRRRDRTIPKLFLSRTMVPDDRLTREASEVGVIILTQERLHGAPGPRGVRGISAGDTSCPAMNRHDVWGLIMAINFGQVSRVVVSTSWGPGRFGRFGCLCWAMADRCRYQARPGQVRGSSAHRTHFS